MFKNKWRNKTYLLRITSKMVVDLEKDAKATDKGSASSLPLSSTIGKQAHSIYQQPELYENHEARPNNCEYASSAE